MTSDRLAGAVLILRPMSSDDDAVLDAIREEMRCAEVYQNAVCRKVWHQCVGKDHNGSCPVAVAGAAWMSATDARRKL